MNDRVYGIVENPKKDLILSYQKGLASMVSTFFDNKTISGVKTSVNEELAQELHKRVINKFKRRIVYVRFKDNVAEIF